MKPLKQYTNHQPGATERLEYRLQSVYNTRLNSFGCYFCTDFCTFLVSLVILEQFNAAIDYNNKTLANPTTFFFAFK